MSMNFVENKSFDYVHRALPKFRSRVTPEIVGAVAKLAKDTKLPAREMFRSDADYVFCMLRPDFVALCTAFYHTRPEACVPLGRQLERKQLEELDTTLVAEILDLG